MTNRATDLNRILLLLLCACLLLPLFPGAAAEDNLPCAAELSAGAVFYTGRDLKEAIGTLEKAAVVRVTETDNEAVRITCRLAGKPFEAWVNRKDLRLIDPATPTDLRTDDLLLPAVLPAEEEPAPDAVAAEEPDEAEDTSEDSDANPQQEENDLTPGVIPAEEKDETDDSPAGLLSDGVPEEETVPSGVILNVVEDESEESPADSDSDPVQEDEPVPAVIRAETEEAPLITEETPVSFGSLPDGTVLSGDSLSSEEPEAGTEYVVTEGSLVAVRYENNELPAIRDQGFYNTCWTFAAVGGMEADLIRAGANPSIDLSEFFLAYYSAHNYAYPKAGGDGDSVVYQGKDSYLNNGGHSDLAWHILATLIGTTTESDNPYPADNDPDKLPSVYTSIAAQITGAYNLDISDRDQIKQQIMAHGAVKVSIWLPDDPESRIYSVGGGRVGYNASTAALYGTNSVTNHDVLLVGWDDRYGTGNFINGLRPKTEGAWKVRNSWGTSWGKGGYFWLSYADASVSKAASFDADMTDKSDFCYSYDKSYAPTSIIADPEQPDKAAVRQKFTVDGQETLHAVGVETVTDGLALTASVRIGGKVVASSETVSAAHNGFYLLTLKTPYAVSGRTEAEVEVTYAAQAPGALVYIPYQYKGEKYLAQTDILFTSDVGGGGFTINGKTVNRGDSTIKLYTKKHGAEGLVTEISLDRPALALSTGETVTLTPDITPANATNPALRWYTSDENIVYLSGDGVVTAGPKGGTAVVTAVSSNGVTATCVISVNSGLKSVKIKGFDNRINPVKENSGIIEGLGSHLTLKTELTPAKGNGTDLIWTTSDPSVISIVRTDGGSCEVCFIRNGNARITVTARNVPGITDWVEFRVDLPVHDLEISLDQNAVVMPEGEGVRLTASIRPEGAWKGRPVWTSSNPSVASVTDRGYVTGLRDGTAVITASAGDKTASCRVTVTTRDPVKAFVYRMYRVCLLREPDEGGLVYWTNLLKGRKQTGAEVAFGFFTSNEMTARNLNDADYVERAYESILGRASDPGGKAYWLQKLESGISRKALISGFAASDEFGVICREYGIVQGSCAATEDRDRNHGVTAYVSRLYTRMQGRSFDIEGLNYWCRIILKAPAKATLVQVAVDGFMHSNEFIAKKLNDTEFVKVMYRTFLDREAEPAGLQYWLNKIASGMSRESIAAGFAASDEFGAIMARYGF